MQKSSRPWTTKQVASMIDNGSLVFDNAVQRSFVWDKSRMSLLIDSILRDYPVPPFYAVVDGRTVKTPKGMVSVYDCLDGKQRNTTIHKFFNNEFALEGLEPIMTNDGEVDLNGLTYETLPEELQDIFKTAHLTVYSFENATEEDIIEIMTRLNNGKPLSAIDLTRIKAKDLAGISRVGQHKLFTTYLSQKAIDGRQQEDIVVKTYVQLMNEAPSLDNKDIRSVYQTLEITSELEARLNAIYDLMFDTCEYLINKSAEKKVSVYKKVARKLVMKTHMVSVTKIFDKAVTDGRSAENMAACLEQFFDEGSPSTDEAYNAACKDGSNHAGNVAARLRALDEQYHFYFGS